MVIEVKDIVKIYSEKSALNRVNFTLESGRIAGLIGANGTGKTTLLNIVAGLLTPTSGDVYIDGKQPEDNPEIIGNISISGNNSGYNRNLKVYQLIDVASTYYPEWDSELLNNLVKEFNIPQKKKIKELSRGINSLLWVAITLSSGCRVLLLDEPTEGLDAENRKKLYKAILEVASRGERTIIISSHLISEVESLLEEVILIDRGRILYHSPIEDIKKLCFEVEGHRDNLEEVLENQTVLNRDEFGEKVRAVIKRDKTYIPSEGVRVNPVNLQDICIYLTKEESINV